MERYYTPEQIAKLLTIQKQTVYAWLRSGKLSGVKLGKIWRVSERHLQGYLGEKTPLPSSQNSSSVQHLTATQIRSLPPEERKRIVAEQLAEAAELYSEFYQEDTTNVSTLTEQTPQNPAKKLTSEEAKRIREEAKKEFMKGVHA